MKTPNTPDVHEQPEALTAVQCSALLGGNGPMTPERHRRYVQRYITAATPYTRAMCELEMLMPLTFIKKADGSLEKTRDLWPQWAKDQWKMLEQILERIKEDAARAS